GGGGRRLAQRRRLTGESSSQPVRRGTTPDASAPSDASTPTPSTIWCGLGSEIRVTSRNLVVMPSNSALRPVRNRNRIASRQQGSATTSSRCPGSATRPAIGISTGRFSPAARPWLGIAQLPGSRTLTQQQLLQKKEDAARIALGRLPAAKHYWTPLASCSRSRRARPASNLWEKPGTSSMRAENSR